MTESEMIRKGQKEGNWFANMQQGSLAKRHQQRKRERQEEKRLLEERNEALRNALNRENDKYGTR